MGTIDAARSAKPKHERFSSLVSTYGKTIQILFGNAPKFRKRIIFFSFLLIAVQTINAVAVFPRSGGHIQHFALFLICLLLIFSTAITLRTMAYLNDTIETGHAAVKELVSHNEVIEATDPARSLRSIGIATGAIPGLPLDRLVRPVFSDLTDGILYTQQDKLAGIVACSFGEAIQPLSVPTAMAFSFLMHLASSKDKELRLILTDKIRAVLANEADHKDFRRTLVQMSIARSILHVRCQPQDRDYFAELARQNSKRFKISQDKGAAEIRLPEERKRPGILVVAVPSAASTYDSNDVVAWMEPTAKSPQEKYDRAVEEASHTAVAYLMIEMRSEVASACSQTADVAVFKEG